MQQRKGPLGDEEEWHKIRLDSCLTATFRLVPSPGRTLVDNILLFLSCLSSVFSMLACSLTLFFLPFLSSCLAISRCLQSMAPKK